MCRKLIPNNLEVALATARHVGYVLGMNTDSYQRGDRVRYARIPSHAGAVVDVLPDCDESVGVVWDDDPTQTVEYLCPHEVVR